MRKVITSLAIVGLVICLGRAGLAGDDDTDARPAGRRLVAIGHGLALLKGEGRMQAKGHGMLLIKDYTGSADIEVHGNGERQELPDGVLYYGFKGVVVVKNAEDVEIMLAGADLHLEAVGRGLARLKGHGVYSVGPVVGPWPVKPRAIPFGPRPDPDPEDEPTD